MPNNTNPSLYSLTVHPRRFLRFCGGVMLALAWLGLNAAQAQTTTYALGTTSLLEAPAAGIDSVVLGVTPPTGAWTNTANADWLHLSLANQTGTGSTNVIFSFDANAGATRSGTLTVAGQTLTVTQVGSTYVAAGSVSTLVSSNLSIPQSVAVDGLGNVYIADTDHNAIKEWTAANNTVTTLVSSGLSLPWGVAVDGIGNVYIADSSDSAIKKWTASNSNVTTLVSSGLFLPDGLAVDGAGNVYISDNGNNAIKKWTAATSNVTTLASLDGGVAVDAAGNVYIADNAIKKWTAASSNVTTLLSSGLWGPFGVAVDGSGNVYIADSDNNAIKKWTAANGIVTTLASGLNIPNAVAVDAAGNVYFADTQNNTIKEVPRVFVDISPRLEGPAAGNDALVVLPATENLSGQFAPASSDPSWLTISGITNGVISLAFTATTSNRTAYITLLGQTIPVTQGTGEYTYALGTTALLEGPSAGSDSVVLAVSPNFGAWTATANAAWLHPSVGYQSGTASTNVIFSFDANADATRSGTLTIAGQTLTVTQAGSTYVPAGVLTTLVSSNLITAQALAVDGVGNVYLADAGHNAIKEWTPSNNTVTTLVAGLLSPGRVAVDGTGNLSIVGTNALQEWTVTNGALTTLVPYPTLRERASGVAVDAGDNVYFPDLSVSASTGSVTNSVLQKLTAANGSPVTLVSSGTNAIYAVAVDVAGNVYFADYAIKKWTAANNTVTTLAAETFVTPTGIAVDGAGNVYFIGSSVIWKWTAANNSITELVYSGLIGPGGVAVDGAGNVYIADAILKAIKELPYAFVDPTPRLEGLVAGSDALPVVLPVTENLLAPFAPTSDQPWLTISGVANGVVSFSFTANAGLSRTAHINLLGQSIPITQTGVTPPTLTSAQMMGNGVCQFCFSNTVGASFTVVCSSDLSAPFSNWTVAGTVTNTAPGQFQFTSQPMTNDGQRFYGVRSP